MTSASPQLGRIAYAREQRAERQRRDAQRLLSARDQALQAADAIVGRAETRLGQAADRFVADPGSEQAMIWRQAVAVAHQTAQVKATDAADALAEQMQQAALMRHLHERNRQQSEWIAQQVVYDAGQRREEREDAEMDDINETRPHGRLATDHKGHRR